MIHTESSPLAGKTVKIRAGRTHPHVTDFGSSDYVVEDWWDRVAGKSWMFCDGNPACLVYALRDPIGLPMDDEVLYGHIGNFGHLVHISEIEPADGKV